MNISGLLTALDELESYRLMREDLRQGEVPAPLGLMRAARAPVLSAIARDLSQEPGRPLLVVAGTTGRAQKLVQSLRDWSAHEPSILRFPEPLTLFYDRAPGQKRSSSDAFGSCPRCTSSRSPRRTRRR